MKLASCSKWLFLLTSVVVSGCGDQTEDSERPDISMIADTSAPNIEFVPNSLNINSGQSVDVVLNVSDDRSTDLTPSINCEEGGMYELLSSQYTANETVNSMTTKCTASVSDDYGNVAEATLIIQINPILLESESPTIAFTPNQLTLYSGQSGETFLNISDDYDEALIAEISCDQGASFNGNEFQAPVTALTITAQCIATVVDSSNNSATTTLTANIAGRAIAELGIDPFDLPNYANQSIPDYITKDNTEDNPITDIGATLGRVLFYDKNLSTDNTVSCASCHQQQHAFSDLDNVSQGVNGVTARHSMRLINARFSEEHRFFWDERAETLEQQTTMPIKDFIEMGFSGEGSQPGFEDLITKLSQIDYYQDLFSLTFGDSEITESRMQKALAQFVRSIQSFDSKYDIGRAQVSDDVSDFPNFTEQENWGKSLFMQNFDWQEQSNRVRLSRGEDPNLGELDTVLNEDGTETVYITYKVAGRTNGGFNCASCHQPPEFSIDPNSGNNAFVRPASNNPSAPSDITNTRAPTLRDVIKDINANNFDVNGIMPFNGGLFHSGQAHFLEDIFGHYEFRRLDLGDNPNIDPRMTRVSSETGETIGLLLNSTRDERHAISAFLYTLTGSDVYHNEKWSDPF